MRVTLPEGAWADRRRLGRSKPTFLLPIVVFEGQCMSQTVSLRPMFSQTGGLACEEMGSSLASFARKIGLRNSNEYNVSFWKCFGRKGYVVVCPGSMRENLTTHTMTHGGPCLRHTVYSEEAGFLWEPLALPLVCEEQGQRAKKGPY
jgi:hypothetical protein